MSKCQQQCSFKVKCICGFASRYTTSTTGVWQGPMNHNWELATAMALVVCRICLEVAFVPDGTTDIGLDDDLLRLHSRKVVLEDFSPINKNPNNVLGIIHHVAVSNSTSLYCGGMWRHAMSPPSIASRSSYCRCQVRPQSHGFV
jgi:hypothetical protein